MGIRFRCEQCGKDYQVNDAAAGKRARCTQCGNTLVVPAATTFVAPQEPPPLPLAPPPLPVRRCPGCGSALPAAAVFCTTCGFDFRSGARMAPTAASAAPRRGVQTWHVIAGVGGVFAVVAILGVVLAIRAVSRAAQRVHMTNARAVTTHALPQPSHTVFGPRPPVATLPEDGVHRYNITVGGTGPAVPMRLYLYLPIGRTARHSLPCVFIAPAGSRLFHGMRLTPDDMPEHLPYVHAGFAVCAYELSGPVPSSAGSHISDQMFAGPAQAFMRADGGVANGKVAIDYVLATVPEVDPDRLYAAGHSSAATVALDLAAADHRIRGVAAYAPVCDLQARLARAMGALERVAPGMTVFAADASPLRHAEDFTCPVYLFHADDDTNVPLEDNQAFADALQAAHKPARFVRVATGGHHDSMIDQGIPGGIAFFQSLGARPQPPVISSQAEREFKAGTLSQKRANN